MTCGVKGRGLDALTGGLYLDCLSLLFKFAVNEGHDVVNPVRTAKADIMAEYRNTAEFRSRNENNSKRRVNRMFLRRRRWATLIPDETRRGARWDRGRRACGIGSG